MWKQEQINKFNRSLICSVIPSAIVAFVGCCVGTTALNSGSCTIVITSALLYCLSFKMAPKIEREIIAAYDNTISFVESLLTQMMNRNQNTRLAIAY